METFLRGILEIILYGLTYYTGACILFLASLGQLPLAPLSSLHDRNKKERWYHFNLWRHRPMQKKALRTEVICLTGFFAWIALGLTAYRTGQSGNKHQMEAADPPSTSAP